MSGALVKNDTLSLFECVDVINCTCDKSIILHGEATNDTVNIIAMNTSMENIAGNNFVFCGKGQPYVMRMNTFTN